MRALALLVPAASALVLTGCTLAHSLQLAEPVGRGNTDVSLEAGAGAMIGAGDGLMAPHADITVRHGVSDQVDVAFRSGSSGWGVGVKRAVAFESVPSLKLAGVARAGFLPPFESSMVPSAQATVGGILQWSATSRLHLLFAPNLTLYSIAMGAEDVGFGRLEAVAADGRIVSQNSDLLLMPMATIGLGVDVLPTARIILEAGAPLHPAIFSQAQTAGLPFSGAIALQWRPRTTAAAQTAP